VLLCYDCYNGVTNEEEDIISAIEPQLFSIGTMSLCNITQFVKTTDVEIMDTYVKITISEQEFEV
jgi:hypothetical protein